MRNISHQCGLEGCRVGEASNPGPVQTRNDRRLHRTQLDHESGSVVASAQSRRGDSPIHPRSVYTPVSGTESDDEPLIQGPSRVRRSGSLDEGRDALRVRRLKLLPESQEVVTANRFDVLRVSEEDHVHAANRDPIVPSCGGFLWQCQQPRIPCQYRRGCG